MNERGIEYQHDRNDDGRHSHQKGHGEAALSGVDTNLTLNFEPLSNDVRKIVENLSQIAAGFALQHNRSDEELHIDKRNALGEIDKGIADGHAKFLLFVELAKFGGDRFRDFVGNHFERSGEAVAGANRASQGVDSLGKKRLKLLKSIGPTVGGVGVRQQGANQQGDPGDLDPLAQVKSGDRCDDSSDDA